VLTIPVLFAVMAHELFGADWVPALLLNHWLQLALITPVMVYTGCRSTRGAGGADRLACGEPLPEMPSVMGTGGWPR
jgi:hypothetical protein